MVGRLLSRWRRGAPRGARVAWLLALVALAVPAAAQTAEAPSVVEQMRSLRLKLRAAEVMGTMGPSAPARTVEALEPDSVHDPRRMFWWMHSRREFPALAVGPPAPPVPEPAAAEEPPPRPVLESIRWDKVGAFEQEAFLERFREALWTNEGMRSRTPLDTIPTPELRARLNGFYGAPTRSPLARAEVGYTGSTFVQFEYWFVVNDSIPFVVMDVDGPFGRGLVLAGALRDKAVHAQLKRDLTRRLIERPRPMAYVDYYQSQERDQWYRTGFDGEEFYTVEIRRPRWARRARGDERWYDFR
ncbi:MAG: hypothetical protein R3362_04550 [Rhodothermales bacterium]|nr:hypothetical protein [Rhodothermales bacterium]